MSSCLSSGVPEVAAPTPVYQPQYSIAEECLSYCQPSQAKVKMNLETFCLKDYVLKVQVRAKERSGPWWQISLLVQSVFRVGSSPVKRGPQSLWVPDRDLSCGCPSLQVGRTFLLIGAEENRRGWAPGERRLVADRSTMALQWREHWNPKLRGFRSQDNKGKCPPNTKSITDTHTHSQTHDEHIPPQPEKLQHETLPLPKSKKTAYNNASNTHGGITDAHDPQKREDLEHDGDRFSNGYAQNPLQETQPPPSDASPTTSPPNMHHSTALPPGSPVPSVTN